MTALTLFKDLPFSKREQQSFADQIITDVTDGFVDPLQADLRLKAMEETIKKIRKDKRFNECLFDEAEKYGKSFSIEGVKIEIGSRTTKDYSGLDPVYDDLISQAEKLKSMIEAREKMLSVGVNPETGETYGKPKTSTTTFLKYTF